MKKCIKCGRLISLNDFYKHSGMRDGHLNKCKKCHCFETSIKNGKYKRFCVECKKEFNTTFTEIKRGGANCCSRKCWYRHFKKIVKRDNKSPNWKGDKVGIDALHNWVEKHLGKPKKCSKCQTVKAKKYDWANISGKYKRDLNDWIRLCRKCHFNFDKKERSKKWRITVKQKYGWKVKL